MTDAWPFCKLQTSAYVPALQINPGGGTKLIKPQTVRVKSREGPKKSEGAEHVLELDRVEVASKIPQHLTSEPSKTVMKLPTAHPQRQRQSPSLCTYRISSMKPDFQHLQGAALGCALKFRRNAHAGHCGILMRPAVVCRVLSHSFWRMAG